MNNPIETNFCITDPDPEKATREYIDYISNINDQVGENAPAPVKEVYRTIARGTGFEDYEDGVLSNFSIENFYSFWEDYNNMVNLKNIVSAYGYKTKIENNNNDYNLFNVCKKVSEYNKKILYTFFCNKIIASDQNSIFDYPVLGKNQGKCEIQKNNIYNYFTNLKGVKGVGLSRCIGDQEEDNTDSIMEVFCSNMIPDVEDQSLFVSNSKDIYKWCGCYVKPSNFFEYSGVTENVCNPLCSNPSSIKIYGDIGTKNNTSAIQEKCNQTICAIGKISLKSTNFKGQINFNQICPGCVDQGNCLCIIDTSVSGVLDKIQTNKGGTQDKFNFQQVCPNSECVLSKQDGSYEKIECNTDNPANTNKDPYLGYTGDGLLRNLSKIKNFTQENYIFFLSVSGFFILFFIVSLIAITDVNINRFIFRRKVNTELKEGKGKKLDINIF